MELLKRKYLNESNNIVKLGTNFEREFSLVSNIIKFSFMFPLEKLREIDYFEVKCNQINKMKEFDDIIFEGTELFKLKSIEVMPILMMNGESKDFAKLSYFGAVKGCRYSTLLNHGYVLQDGVVNYRLQDTTVSNNWRFDTKTTINDGYFNRTLY